MADMQQQNEIGMTDLPSSNNDPLSHGELQLSNAHPSSISDNMDDLEISVTPSNDRPPSLSPPPPPTRPSTAQGRRIGTDEVEIEMTQMQVLAHAAEESQSLENITISTSPPATVSFARQNLSNDLFWDPFDVISDQAHKSDGAPVDGSDAMYNLFKAAADQASPQHMPTNVQQHECTSSNRAQRRLLQESLHLNHQPLQHLYDAPNTLLLDAAPSCFRDIPELPIESDLQDGQPLTRSVFDDSNWAQFSDSPDFSPQSMATAIPSIRPLPPAMQTPVQGVEMGRQITALVRQEPDVASLSTSFQFGVVQAIPVTVGENPFVTPQNPFATPRANSGLDM